MTTGRGGSGAEVSVNHIKHKKYKRYTNNGICVLVQSTGYNF